MFGQQYWHHKELDSPLSLHLLVNAKAYAPSFPNLR